MMWSLPCRPTVKRQCSSLLGTAPLPMKVLTTPMPLSAASRLSWVEARLRMAPLPARISGLLAPMIVSTARATALWSAPGAAGLDRRDRRARRLVLGDVLRQLDQHRAGLLGLGDLEGLAHDLGDVVRLVHRLRPLGDGAEHGDRVHVLVALLVQPLGAGLADEADHGRAVHVGVGDAGHEIGGAGAEGAEADARLAGQPAVDVGHEGRRLLVATEDEVDVALDQRHHHVGVLLAGNAEDVGHALGFEAPDQKIGRFHATPVGGSVTAAAPAQARGARCGRGAP